MFCPKCDNGYNITNKLPNVDIKKGQEGGDKAVKDSEDDITGTLDDIITSILSKKKIDNSIVKKVDLDYLKKNKLYSQLDNTKKEYITNYIISSQTTKAIKKQEYNITSINYFICYNCGFYETIKPGTVIFSKKLDNNDTYKNIEDYQYMLLDNTLPRTSNYVCKNEKCKTHENKELKEAIFFRENNNNYQLIYLCVYCKKHWKN